jgi:hypothetical protein
MKRSQLLFPDPRSKNVLPSFHLQPTVLALDIAPLHLALHPDVDEEEAHEKFGGAQ